MEAKEGAEEAAANKLVLPGLVNTDYHFPSSSSSLTLHHPHKDIPRTTFLTTTVATTPAITPATRATFIDGGNSVDGGE